MWWPFILWNFHHLLGSGPVTYKLGDDKRGISCVWRTSFHIYSRLVFIGHEILLRLPALLEGRHGPNMRDIMAFVLLLWRIRVSKCLLLIIFILLICTSLISLYVTFGVCHYLRHVNDMSLGGPFIKMLGPQSVLASSYDHLLIGVGDLVNHLIESRKILPLGFWRARLDVDRLVFDIFLCLLAKNWWTNFFTRSW